MAATGRVESADLKGTGRSGRAGDVAALEAAGYARVRVLEGGILAWVADVDPSQASY